MDGVLINTEMRDKEFFDCLKGMPHAIIISDIAGVIVYANNKAEMFSGYASLKGKLRGDLIEKEAPAPDGIDTHLNKPVIEDGFLMDVNSKRQAILYSAAALIMDNKHYLVESFITRSDNMRLEQLIAMRSNQLQQIINLKNRSEIRVQREKSKLKTLLNNLSDALFLHDTEGKILEVNQKACDRLGYSKEEFMKLNVADIDSQVDQKYAAELLEKLHTRNHVRFETKHTARSGKEIDTEVIARMIDYEGKKAILGSARNVTLRKKYESELRQAKEKAEQSEKLKTAILNNISHELRTPLNGLLGFLDVLENDDISDEEKNEYIGVMKSSGSRLVNTVNNLIEVSMLDSGLSEVEKESFSLRRMIDELIEENKGRYVKQLERLSVQLDIEPGHDFVTTDKGKLRQLLLNLMDNAFKFTLKGTVKIMVYSNAKDLTVKIKDTGMGIPPERLSKVFMPFEQVDYSDTRRFEGNGMGLPVAQGMARHLGGTIEVSSVLDEGSVFTLKLPGVLGASEVKNKVSYHSKETKKKSSGKILVVEDDPANFTFLNAVLSKSGFKVYHSEDGLEAIEMATDGLGVDLVIMDLKLPQLNGIEATKAIKKERSDLPVIAYSAFVMNHEEHQAKEAGCDLFLPKPARKHQILEAIKKCLKQ